MLRLARAQDWALDREAFVELALSLQDPLPEARRLLARKVVRLVEYFQVRGAGWRGVGWGGVG